MEEASATISAMVDRLKEVEIKSRARVFVELRGEARVKAVYLLF